MKLILPLVCFLLLASPAAADTLLTTLVMPGVIQPSGQIIDSYFVFGASVSPCCGSAEMRRSYFPSDVGAVSVATPEELAAFRAILLGDYRLYGATLHTPWGPGFTDVVDFPGYTLTQITQTLDRFETYEDCRIPGGPCNIGAVAQQTIRLYGVAFVPEPASVVLLLVSFAVLQINRRNR